MISDSPHRRYQPSTGPDRVVGTFDELSDEDFLRRIAISLRKETRYREADRLTAIADRIKSLRELTAP